MGRVSSFVFMPVCFLSVPSLTESNEGRGTAEARRAPAARLLAARRPQHSSRLAPEPNPSVLGYNNSKKKLK